MEKNKIISRLNRIEGQVRGIRRMLEEKRYCMDVLTQTQAIKSALARVEDAILENHSRSCVEEAIASGDPSAQREKFSELVELMTRARRS